MEQVGQQLTYCHTARNNFFRRSWYLTTAGWLLVVISFTAATEEYNGTTWTTVGILNTLQDKLEEQEV
jgi:hypothetical protein